MITGKNAWDIVAKSGFYKLPLGYGLFHRVTKFHEWKPVKLHWCILRDHYYEGGKNTGLHSYELCCSSHSINNEYMGPRFLWEKNKYEFESIGIDFVDVGNCI
jgi:hypothetical protein